MKLQPHETELTGKWTTERGEVRPDTICDRINWLVKNHLKLVAHSKEWGAWLTLFQDPDDGRYWERTYPQSEMHGGGPPRLAVITPDEAKQKYEIGSS